MDGRLWEAMQFVKVILLLPYFSGAGLWQCHFFVFETVTWYFYSLTHRTEADLKHVTRRAMRSDKSAIFYGVFVAVLCLLGFSGNAFIREGKTLDSVALPKEKALPRRSSNSINYDRIRYPAHMSRGKYENWQNAYRFSPGDLSCIVFTDRAHEIIVMTTSHLQCNHALLSPC